MSLVPRALVCLSFTGIIQACMAPVSVGSATNDEFAHTAPQRMHVFNAHLASGGRRRRRPSSAAVIAVIDNCEFILRLCLNISFRHPENGCCSGWRPLHHHCFCFICHLCLVCSICVSRQCVCVGLHAQITILNIAICVSALNDTAILISHVARTTIQLCVICVRRYFSLRFILRHQPQTRAYCIITFRCTLFMSAALANFISRQTNRGQLHPIKLSIDSNCGFDCSAEHTKSLAIKQRNKQNAKFISNIFLIQWIFS